MSEIDRLQGILAEPLGYLHPQRLVLPAGFDGPQARSVLNRIVLEGLQLQGPWPPITLSGVAKQWVRHWWQLPYIALLLGAYRLRFGLARGAALACLPMSVRRFASYNLGLRGDLALQCPAVSMEQVEAAGLNALWSWHEQVPVPLLERLALQFSVPVVQLQRHWPLMQPDPTLFFLAVQHARLHPLPD
ncbi:type III secretion apparatus protein OrgA/MxiK [Pseudomonas sp. NFACC24-1]|uniref:secretion system protein n=1 Tax=Pseudomonas sp. NFACC24-1 TaxID=1566189 RepID=UPI0008EC1137|nr:secretion system protein [Pseudomonas sp. NFACC24-1]SFN54353.1 type III secretion apparatus protein OrgA/MxiK [Pseudomonas sp. NFACC24-1]